MPSLSSGSDTLLLVLLVGLALAQDSLAERNSVALGRFRFYDSTQLEERYCQQLRDYSQIKSQKYFFSIFSYFQLDFQFPNWKSDKMRNANWKCEMQLEAIGH